MQKNKVEVSRNVKEQLNTVRKQFDKNGIDLELVGAGQTLFASLEHALKRVKTDRSYIAKDIEYRLNLVEKDGKQIKLKPRYALIELIKGDPEFWIAWIKQHRVFEKTGLDSDRPTIHRIDSNGHYEFGNIAVLPRGEHQQEHAIEVALVEFSNGVKIMDTYNSKTKMNQSLEVTEYKVNSMLKRPHMVIDEATGKELSSSVLAMPIRRLKPTATEEEYKAQMEANGLTYSPPEVRAESNKRMLE